MIDEPPPSVAPEITASVRAEVKPHLPTQERADGSLVIDLMPLAPPPQNECITPEPDPLNPEIVVCGDTGLSPRHGPQIGPTDEEQFGSAIPRARLRLSDHTEVELNAANSGVGGWNANGGEVRVKIDF